MSTLSPTAIVRAATQQLDDGLSVSLDTVARAVGLTKAGVMHHFPTKQALMEAVVDDVLDRWETGLAEYLDGSVTEASAATRFRAYVDWSFFGDFGEADLVALSDPKLRGPLTTRWSDRMIPWLAIPDTATADERARLTAVRFLGDGAWIASAADFLPPTAAERAQIALVAHALLEGITV